MGKRRRTMRRMVLLLALAALISVNGEDGLISPDRDSAWLKGDRLPGESACSWEGGAWSHSALHRDRGVQCLLDVSGALKSQAEQRKLKAQVGACVKKRLVGAVGQKSAVSLIDEMD